MVKYNENSEHLNPFYYSTERYVSNQDSNSDRETDRSMIIGMRILRDRMKRDGIDVSKNKKILI